MRITAKKPNPMKELYRRLQAAGLPRKYVRTALLPSWWNDEIAVNPAGYTEAVMLLSRHSGLDVRALLADTDKLRLSDAAWARLKKSRRAAGDDLMIARGLATQVASYAAMGAEPIPLKVPTSARARCARRFSTKATCGSASTTSWMPAGLAGSRWCTCQLSRKV